MTQQKIFRQLTAAACRRESLLARTNAVRLVNGVGDRMDGLVLEQYNRHFVAMIHDARWRLEREALCAFVAGRGGQYLIAKDRTGPGAPLPETLQREVWLNTAGTAGTVVEENGLKFAVDLDDALNSGLFLDMRHNRQLVSQAARGRRVLNCFAYTCSFGVSCRAAGATGVTNVDISRKVLDRGRRNYELNDLVPAADEFIRADAVSYLTRAAKKDNRFDVIILDPPSFARHEGKTFTVKKHLAGLIASAFRVLTPGGLLFVATNLSGMTHAQLTAMIHSAAEKTRISDIQRLGQDLDFPGSGLIPESSLTALLIKTGARRDPIKAVPPSMR